MLNDVPQENSRGESCQKVPQPCHSYPCLHQAALKPSMKWNLNYVILTSQGRIPFIQISYKIHGNFEIILINLKSATVFILKMLQKYVRKNLCCMFFIYCASFFGDFLHLFLFHTFISHFLANLSVHSSQGAQKNTSYTSYIYPGDEGDI